MISHPNTKILLIEDNDSNAGDYLHMLQKEMHTCERAGAMEDGLAKANSFQPDAVILDLQIPSRPGLADENVKHGLQTLEELLQADPFRPVIILSAHSRDRELMRKVYELTRGGPFVFKDAPDLELEILKSIAVALSAPSFQASKTVKAFKKLVDQNEKEDIYRKFIAEHWPLLLGPEYKECHSPYPITRGGSIDILAIRHDDFADLWELKRPGDPLFQKYNQWLHHSTECAKAIGQLMEYYDCALKERDKGRGSYEKRQGISADLHRPRGFIIIGRYSSDPEEARNERERLRLENSFLAGISILSYDDLLERAGQFLDFLHRHRNGANKPI